MCEFFSYHEWIRTLFYNLESRAGQITGSHVIQLQITDMNVIKVYELQITLEFAAILQITNW